MKKKEEIEKMLKKQKKKLEVVKELYNHMTEFELAITSGVTMREISLIKSKIKILKWVLED